MAPTTEERGSLRDSNEASQREMLRRAIRDSGGNMSRAATLLGVSRNTLYRRCKRLNIPLQRVNGVSV